MPVIGQPINLGLLRQALIDRCYLDAGDPRLDSANLNRILNEAMQRFDVAAPGGWPWDWTVFPTFVSPGQAIVSWGPSAIVHKVSYILIGDQNGQWQFPIERLTREEQLDRYPLDSDQRTPQTYAIMGYPDGGALGEPTTALHLRPIPNDIYAITIAGWQLIPEFVADADPVPTVNDRMISDWNPAIIEYAAALIYRAADDLSEAVSALTDFDAQVLAMRKSSRRTYGPGVANFPNSAVSDTIA